MPKSESEMLLSRSNNATTTSLVNGINRLVVISASTQAANKLVSTILYVQMYGVSLTFLQQNHILGFRSLDTVCYSHRFLLHPGAPLNLKDYHIFYWKTIFFPNPRPWYITVRISLFRRKMVSLFSLIITFIVDSELSLAFWFSVKCEDMLFA